MMKISASFIKTQASAASFHDRFGFNFNAFRTKYSTQPSPILSADGRINVHDIISQERLLLARNASISERGFRVVVQIC